MNERIGDKGRRRGVQIRDRIQELRRVRAGDLKENAKNWRLHPERQRRALRGLLREIGYADALLAREENGELILVDGHLRRSLDPDQVLPVLVLDVTAEEADLLLATLDSLAGLAEPDPERLERLLSGVDSASASVQELLAEVARGAGLPVIVGRTDPDEIPETPPARTKRGDLWILGRHRLACGDVRLAEQITALMGGSLADCLWTDPPFGVSYTGKTPAALRIENDRPDELEAMIAASFATIDAALQPGAALYVAHPSGSGSVIFAEQFLARSWRLRQTLIWVKDAMVLGHSDYHFAHESILYGYKPGRGRFGRGHQGWYGTNAETSVFEIPRPRASRDHPTAKPAELVARMINNSTRLGQIVLDPFVGSGTTIIACEQYGRTAFTMDVDPRYVDVAVSRWEAFTSATAVLVSGGVAM
jgi:DNA modification methylase